MNTTAVTSRGRVTIPKQLRQHMGIGAGSRIEFMVVGNRVEIRVAVAPCMVKASGFGMLKSRRAAVPADFGPASS